MAELKIHAMIELSGVQRCFMSLLNRSFPPPPPPPHPLFTGMFDALCFVMKISDHSESFQIKLLLA